MFKIYEDVETYEVYYVGSTLDIKALFKSIRRNRSTNLYPLFSETPKFSENKNIYALCVNYDDNFITVVNSDTMLSMIIDDLVQEMK